MRPTPFNMIMFFIFWVLMIIGIIALANGLVG